MLFHQVANDSSKFFFSGAAIIAYKSLHFSVEKKNVLDISLIIIAYQLMWKCCKTGLVIWIHVIIRRHACMPIIEHDKLRKFKFCKYR